MKRSSGNGWISLVYPVANASLVLKCLCLTLLSVYIASVANPDLVYQGDLSAIAVHGEWWRFLTGLVLHANLFHVLFNLIALWSLALLAEQFYSPSSWLLTFLVGGIAGGVLTMYVLPQAHLIGASGGIFAVFGMCISPQIRALMLERDALWSAPQRVVIRSWLLLLILNAVLGFVIPNIGWQAHAAGLIVGVFMGMLFPLKGKLSVRLSRPGVVRVAGARALRRTSSEIQLAHLKIQKSDAFDPESDFIALVREDFEIFGSKKYQVLEVWGAGHSAASVAAHRVEDMVLLAEPLGVKPYALLPLPQNKLPIQLSPSVMPARLIA